MKKIYRFMGMLALAAITAACAEKLPELENPGNNTDQEQEQEQEQVVGKITLSSAETIVLSDEGDSKELSFEATLEWTASANEEFVTVDPASGEAGEATINVTVAANEDYDPRNAIITLTCGEDTKTINLTQKQKGALLLTESTFTVAAEGQVITVRAKANSNVTYTIAEAAQSWITTAVALNGLVDYSFNFEIAANEVEEARTGQIVFTNESGSETVTIEQAGAEPEVTCLTISDAASLELFATLVAEGKTELDALVTASFDASSLTWVPVENYTGLFDGNGQTITGLTQPLFGVLGGVVKNLTLNSDITATDDDNWGIFAKQVNPSSELDDVAGLQNCTAKGSLTYTTAELTKDCQIGGLVGYNNGGALTDCINEATITMCDNGETYAYEVSIGGVVGHSQSGNVSATNNGKVEITKLQCTKLYLGGVAGQTASDSMTGTNNGTLTISEACTVEKGHILAGGVVGNAKAPLTDCTNTGTISNAGTVITEGRFIDLGGIVGYNEVDAPLTDCSNSGDVINTGNSAGYICVGGVSGETEAVINGCANTGNISNSGTSDNGKPTCVGGVAGLAYAIDVTSCSSATGKITNTSASLGVRVGGIVGIYDTAEAVNVSNCANESEIYISNEVSVATDDQILVGGIVGRGSPITFTTCENKGEIMVEMYGEDNLGGVIAGGIFGDNQSSEVYLNDCYNCVNSNKIETYFKTKVTTKDAPKLHAVGGIAGRILESTATCETIGEIKECSNTGYLYDESNRGYLGGIVAELQEGNIIGCTNANIVEFAYYAVQNVHIAVGGIVGNAWGKAKNITGCTNSGGVIAVTNSDVTRGNYIGGIVGWAENECEVSECENTGNVTSNTCANSSKPVAMAGGIIGYKESTSTDSGNINRGDVTSLARYNRAGAAGGVVGALHYGTIEACYNYGTIEAGEKAEDDGWGDTNAVYVNGRAGSIVGFYGTKDSGSYKKCEGTVTKCYVGGAIKGKYTNGELTTITADNFGGCIVGDGDDPTDCFFVGN